MDFLIVPDAYAASDISSGKWSADADRLSSGILSFEPFASTHALINFHQCVIPPIEQRANETPSDIQRTNLGATFGYGGFPHVLFIADTYLIHLAQSMAPSIDAVIVVVDDVRVGGGSAVSHGLPIVVASRAAPAALVVHELGHALANLGDEYESTTMIRSFPIPGQGDLPHPNLTLARVLSVPKTSIRSTIKWGALASRLGIPEKELFFEGGYYRSVGVYRPARSCLMRNHETAKSTFCYVCRDELRRVILSKAGRGVTGQLAVQIDRSLGDPELDGLFCEARFGDLYASAVALDKSQADRRAIIFSALHQTFAECTKRLDLLLRVGDISAAREYARMIRIAFSKTPFERLIVW